MMDSSIEPLSAVNQIDDMALDVKASIENLRIVRLLVSAFGTSHGADVDDLEDLRIATGDICTHLVTNAPEDARLVVRASVMMSETTGAPVVGVHAHVERSTHPGELDPISALVLGAATDAFGIEVWPATPAVAWHEVARDDGPGLELSLQNGSRPTETYGSAVGESDQTVSSDRSLNGWFSRGLRASDTLDESLN